MDGFWRAGFGDDSTDGISVPEPIGTIGRFRMWLQRKVPGRPATELLAKPGGVELGRRIAEAAHKIHTARVPPDRTHGMIDELRILHDCLGVVARTEPRWADRLERVLGACDRLGSATPSTRPVGIHRDFYADQVIVARNRLYAIDFDLYCAGDPGLDIGNFLGHVTEQSLRTLGNPDGLAAVERAMEDRFVELSGEQVRPSVRAYATLTLVRHIYLSTRFADRRHPDARPARVVRRAAGRMDAIARRCCVVMCVLARTRVGGLRGQRLGGMIGVRHVHVERSTVTRDHVEAARISRCRSIPTWK